jgi:hypothetical protein
MEKTELLRSKGISVALQTETINALETRQRHTYYPYIKTEIRHFNLEYLAKEKIVSNSISLIDCEIKIPH